MSNRRPSDWRFLKRGSEDMVYLMELHFSELVKRTPELQHAIMQIKLANAAICNIMDKFAELDEEDDE